MEIRVLFLSRSFYPVVGGQESVAHALAEGLALLKVPVMLITLTPLAGADEIACRYPVLRNPTLREWRSAMSWCTLLFHHSMSLRMAVPLLIFNRKWIVLHHILYRENSRVKTHFRKWKIGLSRHAHTLFCSEFVAAQLGNPGQTLPCPLDSSTFYRNTTITRSRQLLFAGRLVKDKGCGLLIHALAELKTKALTCQLTIAGDGPEFTALFELVSQLGLADQVTFTGALSPAALAAEMNCHLVLVVPSLFNEPFGLVALEGLSCGCIPVISNCGGLPAAALGFGVLFKPGSSKDLTEKLIAVLRNPTQWMPCRQLLSLELQRYDRNRVAKSYLDYFNGLR